MLLQVVYVEQAGSPRAPNTMRETLGLIDVRAGDEPVHARRKVLDLHGAAHIADNPSARAVSIRASADISVTTTESGSQSNYRPTDWDDLSILVCAPIGGATITGFDVFSCRRMEKLIYCRSGGPVTLLHESALSRHDNRIRTDTGANIVLEPGEAARLVRDLYGARWIAKRVPGPSGPVESNLNFSLAENSAHLQTIGTQ